MTLFQQVPDAIEWKKEALRMSFFGRPISDMDNDELLATIGWFKNEQTVRFECQSREREVMNLITLQGKQ